MRGNKKKGLIPGFSCAGQIFRAEFGSFLSRGFLSRGALRAVLRCGLVLTVIFTFTLGGFPIENIHCVCEWVGRMRGGRREWERERDLSLLGLSLLPKSLDFWVLHPLVSLLLRGARARSSSSDLCLYGGDKRWPTTWRRRSDLNGPKVKGAHLFHKRVIICVIGSFIATFFLKSKICEKFIFQNLSDQFELFFSVV